jgi:hypothetical protein
MKTASILGIILIILGIVSLAYFAAPLRLLVQAVEPQRSNPVAPILGGPALIRGIALLLATDTLTEKYYLTTPMPLSTRYELLK